ncbi:MAG: hypothetical protein K8R58_06160 [Bacteroidales bacterium]|nr:hypothetical protein [Bacteroidales bacterium]
MILADLKDYQESSISEIHKRIGVEINRHTIKNKLDDLITNGLIDKIGEKRWSKYSIKKNM